MLLFAGYIDAVTSLSESCGGGGGSVPESSWGKKDDEDERAFARPMPIDGTFHVQTKNS